MMHGQKNIKWSAILTVDNELRILCRGQILRRKFD